MWPGALPRAYTGLRARAKERGFGAESILLDGPVEAAGRQGVELDGHPIRDLGSTSSFQILISGTCVY